MTLPSIILGVVISTIYGTVFHLFRGGGLGRLILYLILAWVGFWVGQFLGSELGISFINIGTLHIGIATLFSWIFLGVGHWLSRVEIDRNRSKAQ